MSGINAFDEDAFNVGLERVRTALAKGEAWSFCDIELDYAKACGGIDIADIADAGDVAADIRDALAGEPGVYVSHAALEPRLASLEGGKDA